MGNVVGTGIHPIVALVDHRELTRTALLRSFGEAVPDTIFIGMARIGDLAGHAAETLRAVILHIDHTETGNGSLQEAIANLRQSLGGVPLITLSDSADEDSLRASIEGGASAHLTTAMPLEIAAATLRLVMLGGTSFPAPAVWVKRVRYCAVRTGTAGQRLTQREEEVLKLVGQGAQNKIIAFRLNMSENTVKVHLHRILQKFHLHNRTEVALLAGAYFANEAHAMPPSGAAIQPRAGVEARIMAALPVQLPEAS